MKILIAVDMEGITGVVHWDQVSPSHAEYQRFRKLMTGDVNATIRGAFEGGADEVIVADGHAYGRNILIEDLDPRARLNSGVPTPYSMVEGIDTGVHGAMFVGYHARIGADNAILDHTWSDERVANLWLDGVLYGEIGLNAAMCGFFDVPVLMISGDQTACSEAELLLGNLEQVIVKRATGRMGAELLPPQLTQERIRQSAKRGVERLRDGTAPVPYRLLGPIEIKVDFVQSDMADKAAFMPGASRYGRSVRYLADDMSIVYRAFRTLLALARG